MSCIYDFRCSLACSNYAYDCPWFPEEGSSSLGDPCCPDKGPKRGIFCFQCSCHIFLVEHETDTLKSILAAGIVSGVKLVIFIVGGFTMAESSFCDRIGPRIAPFVEVLWGEEKVQKRP